jgi:hypothetical protein
VREEADPAVDNVLNLTVFASIGVALAALTLGTYAAINALRQFQESSEEPQPTNDGLNTMHDLGAEGEAEGEGEGKYKGNEEEWQQDDWDNKNYLEEEEEAEP